MNPSFKIADPKNYNRSFGTNNVNVHNVNVHNGNNFNPQQPQEFRKLAHQHNQANPFSPVHDLLRRQR